MNPETAVTCAGLSLAFAGAAEPRDAPRYLDQAQAFGRLAAEYDPGSDISAAVEEKRAWIVASVTRNEARTRWSHLMTRHGGDYARCSGCFVAGVIKASEQSGAGH
jgi:hypothetical protein